MIRHLALVLTDVVDSTALNASVGDAAMREIWDEHNRRSRALIHACEGKEIGRTDGFLLAFESVNQAATFAIAYHQALETLAVPLRARIGIHIGEVDLRPNLPDDIAAGATMFQIDGVALPVAARVSALAQARQTLLTATAKEQLDLPSPRLVSHGYWQLKGISDPVELFELGDDRSEFSRPEDGEKGYQVVLERDTWRPGREIRNTIPGAHDDFVGRSLDLRRLTELVESGARLISVVGMGGMGKTRVVTHFARRWLGEFVGGAWFCDLTQATDADGIFLAVAQGLDLALGRADPRRLLSDAIAGRGRCLVVLDNFEQVAPLAFETVGYWLDQAAEATFIVTTRERLGLAGEHLVTLGPLDPRDASSLFIRRATANHPSFGLGAGDGEAIEELVQLLDGMPLAIELAVGRLGVMSPKTMLSRIGQRFKLLSARTGRSKRQSTLRAAFDWSWELLTTNERRLLAQASVFSGGFTLEAAESVLRLQESGADESVLDTVHSLVDKSFVRANGERFSMLVSVRDYAAEKLAVLAMQPREQDADVRDVERRHGIFYAKPLQGDAKRRAAELENILVACRRAIARQDSEVVTNTAANAWVVLEARGPYQVGIDLIEAALAMKQLPEHDRIRLTNIHGRCFLISGDAARARAQANLAHRRAREEGLRLEELRALSSLAELNVIEGNVDEAKAQHEEAVLGAEELGHAPFHCSALNGLGLYFNRVGQFEAAGIHFQKALEVARRAGQRRWEGGALSNLGNVAANLGDRIAAKKYYDEAIAVARDLDDRVWLGNLLCNLGLFKLDDGDTASAKTDLASSLALARENGLSLLESVVLCNVGLLDEAIGEMTAAESAHRSALEVARRRGDRRSEGQFLGYLGSLLAKRSEIAEGRACLLEGIAILRNVRDRMSLAIVLCRYAECASLWDDLDGGRACLHEATSIAADINVAAGSELAASLERARRAIEDRG